MRFGRKRWRERPDEGFGGVYVDGFSEGVLETLRQVERVHKQGGDLPAFVKRVRRIHEDRLTIRRGPV